jgi:hypothetical protein
MREILMFIQFVLVPLPPFVRLRFPFLDERDGQQEAEFSVSNTNFTNEAYSGIRGINARDVS